MKILDISQETNCHVIVAQGTKEAYQAHPTTTMRADNKTIIAVWNVGHGGHAGDDRDRTIFGKTVDTISPNRFNRRPANAMGRTLFAQHL